MDPAFTVMSPFRNDAKAEDGVLDHAIEALAGAGVPAARRRAPARNAERASATEAAEAAPQGGSSCAVCGRHTDAVPPADGIYYCGECMAARLAQGRPFRFPAGTFQCCPTATEAEAGGVVRCASCGGWYHHACVGIHSAELSEYVNLATTCWYCALPGCSDAIIKRHVSRA